jgi:conjugal transfer/entry exclusion protein
MKSIKIWKKQYFNSLLKPKIMKSKMKISIITIAITLFISNGATAQGLPTYDNTNFVSLIKQLVESGKQTAQMIKSVNFLKDAKESIEKVSSVVQQLRAVQEIAQNNQRLINVMQHDLQDILNSSYIKPEEVTRVAQSFDAIIQNSLDTVDFMGEILSSDNLKMSDAERAEVLKEKELESKEMVSNIQTKTKRYRDIISFRKMQDKVNHRETAY